MRVGAQIGSGATALPLDATRIMYWSTTPGGDRIATSGAFFESDAPWTGGGDRPVVALAPGTVGQGTQCAPSSFIENVADPATPGAIVAQYELRLAYELGRRGINTVMTDYQGLGVKTGTVHPYVNRRAQGAAVLDSIRAAQQIPGTGSSPQSAVGAWGYSQGGGAAAAAAEMAAEYAPELSFEGTYAGSVPADLADTLGRIDGSVLSGAIGYALNGFRAVYPELGPIIDQYTNEAGKEWLATVAGQCLFQTSARYALHRSSEYTTTGEPLLTILRRIPAAEEVLSDNRLGLVAPSGSVWLDSATSDDIVPFDQAAELDTSWCAAGGNIRFAPQQLPEVLPGLGIGHLLPQNFQIGQVQNWLVDRLSGTTDEGTCG
ncbi:lipase family protein [Rhodococcus sp. MEB041]|uniref:lipase family protein n=1 Tax=Rhodococcus sp. MEB041 TaxID=3040323 RepID=UPI002550E7FA|nr:lipase family protein [Rhodococcus sp. MEB041]